MMKKNEEIKFEEDALVPFIYYIPKGAVKVKIYASILNDDDEFITYSTIVKGTDLHDSIINGEYYEFDNAKYVLVDKEGE